MTATSALLVVGADWLLIGLATALVMGRRGHDPFAWLLAGVVLGPLSLPVAVAAARHPGLVRPRRLLAGAVAGGYGLLAVGTRGAGLTPRLLGSVAESLAAGTTVPVLLASEPVTARVQPDESPAPA